MTLYNNYLVYPEGEHQEIFHEIPMNTLVDLNGNPLPLPVRNPRIIAYRVYKVRTLEERGEVNRLFYLELVSVRELMEL